MLDFISVPHVFVMFLHHFGMIYGPNLLTRCLVSVPVFCCLFVSEKLFWQVSRIAPIIYGNYFQYEMKTEPEGQPEGRHRGSRRHLAAAPLGRTWGPPGAMSIASRRPFAYKFPSDLKKKRRRDHNIQNTSEAAAISNPSSGRFRSSFRHPSREGNRRRRHLHHHACHRSDA